MVPAGKSVAIVGTSGSGNFLNLVCVGIEVTVYCSVIKLQTTLMFCSAAGKSTILRMLFRFYDTDSGTVSPFFFSICL